MILKDHLDLLRAELRANGSDTKEFLLQSRSFIESHLDELTAQAAQLTHYRNEYLAATRAEQEAREELRHAREASLILKGDPEAVETYRVLRAERDAARTAAGEGES